MVSGGKVCIVRHIADPLLEIFLDIYPQDNEIRKNRGNFCQECVCVFFKLIMILVVHFLFQRGYRLYRNSSHEYRIYDHLRRE